jgi:hypothetical protein
MDMDFLVQNHLSDDQWALIGCAAALVLSGTLMSLSYFIGQARRASRQMTYVKLNGNPGLAPQPIAENPGRRAA